MKIFSCLIILALIVAATATVCHKKLPHKHRHCKAFDKSWYTPPKHSSKKALSVFGFFAKGLKSTLKNAIGIFNFYARRVIPKTVEKALGAVVHIAKAISFVLNVWIDTIGTIFANIIMAISKIVFCVLGVDVKGDLFFGKLFSHKSCKAPAICGKDYGKRFGWGVYSGKYDNYRDILEFYGLVDLDIDLVIKKYNGVGIKGLVGTKLLVANSIVSMYHLLCRDIKHWKRDDIVLANRYVITVAAALGKGYHADIGVDIVDGFFLYINTGFKASGFVDISTYRNDIIKELDTCSAESWNGAITTLYEGDDGNVKNGGSNGDNGNNNNAGNKSNGGHTEGGSKGSVSKDTSIKKGLSKTSSSSNAESESISSNNSQESSASAAARAASSNISNGNGSSLNENSNTSAESASKSEIKSSEENSFNKSSSSSLSKSEIEWEERSTEEEYNWDSS